MGQGFGCRLNAPVPGEVMFNLGAHIRSPSSMALVFRPLQNPHHKSQDSWKRRFSIRQWANVSGKHFRAAAS